MNKKLTALSTTIILGFGSAFAAPSVKADSNLSGIHSNLIKTNAELSQYQEQLKKLNEQVARVDQAIQDNNKMIADTEGKIQASTSEVQQLQEQIAALNDKIEKRTDILKKRAQAIQENGGSVNYMDVLLGSSSFRDFIDRVSAVATMVQADKDLMDQDAADKQEVQNKQDAVQKKLDGLKSMKEDLLGMREQVLEQKAQNDELKAELQTKQTAKLAERAQLLEQEQAFVPQPSASKISNDQSSNNQSSNNSSSGSASSYSSNASITASINLAAPKTNGDVMDVIKAGYKYIGNSVYVFGGGRNASDIANGRFDCSSFVHWAYTQAGYNLGSSTDSLKNEGTRVSAGDIQPGDLVFFNTYKTDGHVGIYIGGGKFIGSQSSTGVAIANLSSGYWRSHFNGRVVRIINN